MACKMLTKSVLITVVIPAYNEEKYIAKCIESVKEAGKRIVGDVEIIVVANRCSDKTAEIAADSGAIVISTDDYGIAKARNAGAAAATGEILLTFDADSIMHVDALAEVCQRLESGKFIGGGTLSKFDRMSFGITMSALVVAKHLIPIYRKHGVMLGLMFWCYKRDFDEIGGFDESLLSLEDMDFAIRLKNHGKAQGKKYGNIKKQHATTSSRKFDEFGDWYLFKNRSLVKRIFSGKDKEAADGFYYNIRTEEQN